MAKGRSRGLVASAWAARSQACCQVRASAVAVASSRSRVSWRSPITRWVSSVLAQKIPPAVPSSVGIGL